MRKRAEAVVIASFVADSLALGVHWIYDTAQLAREYGRVETFIKPGGNSYHHTKEKGEFTHYGDQAFVLLESMAAKNGFDLADFFHRWQRLFENYTGYIDGATQGTLHNIATGSGPEASGSLSNDLAGASRIFPLVLCYGDDLDRLVTVARAQTLMTHADPLTVDCAEFFSRVLWQILKGSTPLFAIQDVCRHKFNDSMIAACVDDGIASKSMETRDCITRFGQSCHTPETLPGVIHLVTKYEHDLKEALIQAVMAGGDNAARAITVGMILAAYLGHEQLPGEWIAGLVKAAEIQDLMDQIG